MLKKIERGYQAYGETENIAKEEELAHNAFNVAYSKT